MTVYDYVKVLAKERNVDIKSIEVACGFGNGTISKWGKSMPKADILYKVALYFDMPIEYFLTGIRPVQDRMEQVLLDAYRQSDEEGKAVIIQICMNSRDAAIEKGKNINVG